MKTRIIILIVAITILISICTISHSYNWGLSLYPTISTITKDEGGSNFGGLTGGDSSTGFNPQIGLMFIIESSFDDNNGFGVSSGIGYIGKGFSIRQVSHSYDNPTEEFVKAEDLNYKYLYLPLLIKYKYSNKNIGGYGAIGPSIAYFLFHKNTPNDGNDVPFSSEIFQEYWDDGKPFDISLGLRLGFEWYISSNKSVFLEIGFEYGLFNFHKDTHGEEFTSHFVTIMGPAVGIMFM